VNFQINLPQDPLAPCKRPLAHPIPQSETVSFMKVIQNAKCNAIDSNGNKCTGGPMMKAKPQVLNFLYRALQMPLLLTALY
jgi:hypothetical protein